jgi:hypothetical protein
MDLFGASPIVPSACNGHDGSQSVVESDGGCPGPLHGGNPSAVVMAILPISLDADASTKVKRSGSLTA